MRKSPEQPSGTARSLFPTWGANRIGHITVADDAGGREVTGHEVTGHDLPTPSSEPHGITVGPDGALWAALEIGGIARLVAW